MRTSPHSLRRPEDLLVVTELHAQYRRDSGTVRAVDGVSLRVGPSEAVAIAGEAGTGKTTLGLALLGLVPDPPGRIVGGRATLGARDLLRNSPRGGRASGRARLALLRDDPSDLLRRQIPVGAQLASAVSLADPGSVPTTAGARERVAELLHEVGLTPRAEVVDASPECLSSLAQWQVAVALALAGDPTLLITDEPTASLDAVDVATALQRVRDLVGRRRMGWLLLTREIDRALWIADRVAVMYAGRIVEMGPTEALASLPRHPYTQLLQRSSPGCEIERGELPEPIPGRPDHRSQSSADPVSGCPFVARCPLAYDPCGAAPPPEIRVSARHVASCWLLEE